MFSWMDVLSQWRQGIIYPRWADGAQWAYGEPTFLFYPPASWTLGAALGALLPWRVVPGAYCWLALTLAATAMYHLAKRWLPSRDALFAAAFYALNPYHLLIVYWRSAYAELLAAALLPLLLLCILRLDEASLRPTFWLSLILAAAWLTNAPAAVMIHYSAAGLALLVAVERKSARPLWRLAFAVLLGATLVSFYLLPALYEQRWINISQVFSPPVRPQDNFLFTMLSDPDHNRFNLLVSRIALIEIALLAAAVLVSRRERAKSVLWPALVIWGTATVCFMLPVSNLLWEHLPKFRYVQLPFRWLLCMNVAAALLLTIATKGSHNLGWLTRGLVSAALLAAVVFIGRHTQPPWWDTGVDIQEMHQAVLDGAGYEGVDEYVPSGADAYELKRDLPRVTDDAGANANPQIINWAPTEKHFQVDANQPADLTVRLLNYPAWKAFVNGNPVKTSTTDITGLMRVPVQAGANDIVIRFTRTPDRSLGDIISLLAVVILAIAWVRASSTSHPRSVLVATSNPGKLCDFAGAAAEHGITIASIPNFSALLPVIEDGATFEANARKKAEEYSRAVPGEIVLADDSGLEVDALNGEPGVHSARYAAPELQGKEPRAADSNTDDEANNARLLRELADVPSDKRSARFVCVIVAARDGRTLATFRGTAEGVILNAPRGANGFGYDPLFYFPQIGKTFAELSAEEKSRYSHRGVAFRAFLNWSDRIF